MACGGSGSGSGLGSATVHSLPPPLPKSPPDLYGRRKELARLQLVEREKGYLEEELKFVEGLQPASRCCKEIVDFVSANADPIIPTKRKIRKSCKLWKWLCGSSCFNCSWICCCTGCSAQTSVPECCSCPSLTCTSCSGPKCSCWCNPCCCCPSKNACRGCCSSKSISCCSPKSIPCANCCRCKLKCSCLKCPSCSDLSACLGCLRNCCCCNNCCVCC